MNEEYFYLKEEPPEKEFKHLYGRKLTIRGELFGKIIPKEAFCLIPYSKIKFTERYPNRVGDQSLIVFTWLLLILLVGLFVIATIVKF